MAKKPARKQAPPRMGREPANKADEPEEAEEGSSDADADADASEDEEASAEPSIDALVAGLGEDEAAADSEEESDGDGDGDGDGENDGDDEEPAKDAIQLVDSLPIDKEDDLSEVEGEASPRLVSIVESLLFASTKPLRVKQIRKILSEPSVRQIQLALKQLMARSRGEDQGIIVAQVAGGFVLQTAPNNAQWVQKLLQAKPVRLSRPQLEALAVVAYRQPVTRPEIDHIRGVDSGAVLKVLLERELVQIVGKKDEPGRPMLYGTTVNFLEFFNLMSLRDLPDLREFRELSDDTKATLRRKMELGEDEVEALGQEVLEFARETSPEAEEGEGSEDEEGDSGDSGDSDDAGEDAADSDEAEDSDSEEEDVDEDSEEEDDDEDSEEEDDEDSDEEEDEDSDEEEDEDSEEEDDEDSDEEEDEDEEEDSDEEDDEDSDEDDEEDEDSDEEEDEDSDEEEDDEDSDEDDEDDV